MFPGFIFIVSRRIRQGVPLLCVMCVCLYKSTSGLSLISSFILGKMILFFFTFLFDDGIGNDSLFFFLVVSVSSLLDLFRKLLSSGLFNSVRSFHGLLPDPNLHSLRTHCHHLLGLFLAQPKCDAGKSCTRCDNGK